MLVPLTGVLRTRYELCVCLRTRQSETTSSDHSICEGSIQILLFLLYPSIRPSNHPYGRINTSVILLADSLLVEWPVCPIEPVRMNP